MLQPFHSFLVICTTMEVSNGTFSKIAKVVQFSTSLLICLKHLTSATWAEPMLHIHGPESPATFGNPSGLSDTKVLSQPSNVLLQRDACGASKLGCCLSSQKKKIHFCSLWYAQRRTELGYTCEKAAKAQMPDKFQHLSPTQLPPPPQVLHLQILSEEAMWVLSNRTPTAHPTHLTRNSGSHFRRIKYGPHLQNVIIPSAAWKDCVDFTVLKVTSHVSSRLEGGGLRFLIKYYI